MRETHGEDWSGQTHSRARVVLISFQPALLPPITRYQSMCKLCFVNLEIHIKRVHVSPHRIQDQGLTRRRRVVVDAHVDCLWVLLSSGLKPSQKISMDVTQFLVASKLSRISSIPSSIHDRVFVKCRPWLLRIDEGKVLGQNQGLRYHFHATVCRI